MVLFKHKVKTVKFIHIFPAKDRLFLDNFIEFISKKFNIEDHIFIAIGELTHYKHKEEVILYFKNDPRKALSKIYKAEKLFFHGLSGRSPEFLFFQPWLLSKSYWMIWSGDLYHYLHRKKTLKSKIHEFIRSFVIKRMGNIITFLPGDYELAKKWYKTKAKYHNFLLYPNLIYKEIDLSTKKEKSINIQVGNSAVSSLNHMEAFEKLSRYKDRDIKIYCPLSYGGNKEYVNKVKEKGYKIFGNKFIPLLEFMPLKEYLKFLSIIDVAVFANDRHKAMNNIIPLLGLGKKVYLKKETTPYDLFEEKGITVYDIDNLNLDPIDPKVAEKNKEKIAANFSEENLYKQWNNIFTYNNN